VLENNPVDPRIILSAGLDGHIIVWDMEAGIVVKKYFNNVSINIKHWKLNYIICTKLEISLGNLLYI
jgi:hypothetical protein